MRVSKYADTHVGATDDYVVKSLHRLESSVNELSRWIKQSNWIEPSLLNGSAMIEKLKILGSEIARTVSRGATDLRENPLLLAAGFSNCRRRMQINVWRTELHVSHHANRISFVPSFLNRGSRIHQLARLESSLR